MARLSPRRDRNQRPGEQHIPRAQWDALMCRRDARLARGQASDEDTDPGDEEEVAVDPPESEPGPELPVEEPQRLRVIAMFRRTLLFSQGAATALYNGLYSIGNGFSALAGIA